MQQLDNAKQTELVNLLKRKLQDAEANAESAVARATDLDTLCADYEHQLGIQRNGLPARVAREATPKTVAGLQSKIKALQAESQALRGTFRRSLAAREEENQVLRDQMSRMERQFSTQLDALKRGPGGGSPSRGKFGAADADGATMEKLREVRRVCGGTVVTSSRELKCALLLLLLLLLLGVIVVAVVVAVAVAVVGCYCCWVLLCVCASYAGQ